jgi:hypothetical protein
MIALSAALFAAAASCSVPQGEVELQAALAYELFDSRNGPYGWRSLNAAGCTDAALRLLTAYATANGAGLSLEQRLELRFHSGQTLAFSGREGEAIPYFVQANSLEATAEWQAYVAATIAFLKHDAPALAAAREAYATIAPGSMRLTIIDGFVACPQESYSKAAHCKM